MRPLWVLLGLRIVIQLYIYVLGTRKFVQIGSSCLFKATKMNLKACRHQTWMMTLLYIGNCFCAVSITQSSTNVVKGSSLNIIATLDEDGLSWTFKSGTPLTSCSLSFNGCVPSMDKNMVFSASSLTNTSTISIASLNCSINTAIYVASTDSFQTDTVDIDVTTPVSSIMSTTVLTTNKVQSQDLLVEVECVYPKSTITANFTISRSGKPDDTLFPDSIETSTSSSGCECLEATYVVKTTITASQYPNEVVQVQANIGQLSPLVIGDVNFTAGKVSREIRKLSITVTEAGKKSVPWNISVATVLAIVAGIIYRLFKVTIVTTIAELWLFSNQYMFYGSVVYGIQLVIVSAVSDIMNILTAVGVLLYYNDQYIVMTVSVCLFLLFLVTLFSIAGVGIFILIVSFCGEKEKIHIKLKEKEESKKLSTHGIKLKKNTPALFNFKVKARKDAYITLHGIARSSDCQDKDDIEIQIVLGCGSPSRSVASEHILDESNGACLCNVLSHNKYCSFYLACENNSITVMDGEKKTILQWTVSVDNFEMRDITISDIKRDDSKKDGSTKGYSTKDDSTKGYSTKDDSTKNKQGEKPETSAEWIFLFRKGDSLCEIEEHEREIKEDSRDSLCEIEEHEREIKEDSRFKQTVQLICVIIFPIAWLVVGALVVIYLLKSKGKNTDNTDSELGVKLNQNQKELSEQQIKNQNDTKGKWFDFIWFSCFHNSVKPNLTTDDNKPKTMMPGSYLANLPKGRKLPQLGEIVTQGNETRKPKKKDKKKKKIKNQDSNMNDKQQSHSDKQNIAFQPEIAVAADKLEAE